MAQAKKKQSTKTAKKSTGASQSRRKPCNKCSSPSKQQISNRDRNHVYAVTAMSLLAGILLCANAAIMMMA